MFLGIFKTTQGREPLPRNHGHRRKLPTPPVSIARSYAFLGQPDRALDWLSQGIEERDGYIVYMKHEPTFAAMRNNPRFIALVKAAGIP